MFQWKSKNVLSMKVLTDIVAATSIQAKYKGYRVKEDYLKQKEAGEFQI